MAARPVVSDDCTHLLGAAAVMGRTVDVEVLAVVVGLPALDCVDLLAEAAAVGIVERDEGPDRFRFADSSDCDAIAAGLRASERVRLHAAVAEAIGTVHAEHIEAHLLELAAHWSAAAVGDYRQPAMQWVARAARSAAEQRDYETAAQLFRRAIALDTGLLDPAEHCRLLLGLARASYRNWDVHAAIAACRDAGTAAHRIGRSDLQAEAALVVEPTLSPDVNMTLRRLCTDALKALPGTQSGARVRVASRLADVSHYLGDMEAARDACSEIARAIETTEDLHTLAIALHSLQLARSGPDGLRDRDEYAARLADVAHSLDDPVEATWSSLWRIDAALQRGDLVEAARQLAFAHQSADSADEVITRWQLLRAEATLAQAQARFDQALRVADAAAELLSAAGNPLGQLIWSAQAVNIGQHIGFDETLAAALGVPDDAPFDADATVGAVQTLSTALILVARGRTRAAAEAYRSLGPVGEWRDPPHSTLFTLTYGTLVAIALDEQADVRVLRDLLAAHRGLHVASGAGSIAYLGPVELWIGKASAYLGAYSDAITDLEHAMQCCIKNGAAGLAVNAQLELADVLRARSGPGDAKRAREFATAGGKRADLLGMRPLADTARRIVDELADSAPDGLSKREYEVALLVAEGLTNRAIATRLSLSERTAANHVQHILAKLDLANRSQIATWVSSSKMSTD